MRKRKHLWALLAVGAAGLAAPSCDNTDLGVPADPDGPLQVTRLTLLSTDDTTLRPSQVFTDTLSPAVCETNADCDFTATRDTYGTRFSPPNPDSAHQLRVIFNKIPTQVGGKELETPVFPPVQGGPDGSMDTTLPPTKITLNFPEAAKLTSPDGCGTPAVTMSVSLTGTDKTPNPIDIPYGPALQLTLTDEGADPFTALEPGCKYTVALDPGLAGRDGKTIDQTSAAKYATFTTETFRVLQSGVGDDDNDAWEKTAPSKDDPATLKEVGPQTAFDVGTIPNDSVIRIKLNAPIFSDSVEALTPTVTVGGSAVPSLATITQVVTDAKTMKKSCDAGNGRSIYIYPKSGTWGNTAADIKVTLDGSKIFDVVQDGKYPKGRHTLGASLTINAKTTGKASDKDFTGLTTDTVAQSIDAVCKPAPPADMAGNQG